MFRIDISVFDEAVRNRGVRTFYVAASNGWRFYTGAMFPDNVGALLILFQLFPGPCVSVLHGGGRGKGSLILALSH